MPYSITQITTLIGARRFGNTEYTISWLLTDSRSLAFPESTMFFAFRTRVGDGHRYIDDLYRRGVRNFTVDTLPENRENLYPDANFLLTTSPLKALQRLAERHRESFTLPVVAITGSNGKTIVKEWLYQLLAPSFRTIRSPRSYNSQVGVPLSVWLLDKESRIGIFEAGISQPNEMEALRAIIQPIIGIMTNIGSAHQENFGTIEEKCKEKLQLFQDCDTLIYCADDTTIATEISKLPQNVNKVGWSRQDVQAPLYLFNEQTLEGSTCYSYRYKGETRQITLPFSDETSLQNALHAITAALHLGLRPEEIALRAARLEPVAMRLEVKQGVRGLTLINDSYNSDIHSLDIALDFMGRRKVSNNRRTLILSDLLQSGIPREDLYHRIGEMAERRGITQIIGVGPDISSSEKNFKMKAHFFPSTRSLVESGLLNSLHDEVVLLKGARCFNFEQLTSLLSLRVHETTLEVNLEALGENLNHYRSFMAPHTKIVCMVKASAYGSGSIEIAKTLQDRGVDYLAVAVADEGAELRRAGITSGIIVMNPEMSAFNTLFDYNLEPEVYNFELLEALIHAAQREGITDFPVHVKLDTGMHRLGFHPKLEIHRLIDRLRYQNALIPRSVFSHFVGSDSPDFDDFSHQQFQLFDQASRQLQLAFPNKILRHICNSAGIQRFPEYHLDMVRLGLGLYGVDPISNHTLSNVTSLRTTILQIRDVPAGESIGYSRRTVVDQTSRIAALPIGYADGLNRKLGNRRGYCLVNGQPAPYVGNICMDVCMIDVTNIPCKEGDIVEIFGNELPVARLAEWLDTIPYEILTGVSQRVKRIYFQG